MTSFQSKRAFFALILIASCAVGHADDAVTDACYALMHDAAFAAQSDGAKFALAKFEERNCQKQLATAFGAAMVPPRRTASMVNMMALAYELAKRRTQVADSGWYVAGSNAGEKSGGAAVFRIPAPQSGLGGFKGGGAVLMPRQNRDDAALLVPVDQLTQRELRELIKSGKLRGSQ